MKVKLFICSLLVLTFSGCVSNGAATGPGSGYGASYEPVVDYFGIDKLIFRSDLYECQTLASQFKSNSDNAKSSTFSGALLGAAVGAAIGNRSTAKKMAAAGAVGSYVVKVLIRIKMQRML